MKSLKLISFAVVVCVLAVLAWPHPSAGAEGNDKGSVKRFEVDCKFPLAIPGAPASCKGDLVGNAQLTENAFAFGNGLGADGSGGSCALVSSTDTLTTPDGSTIILKTHGMICFETVPGFAVRHNAYLIEGGTGRFRNATGTGNIVFSSENPIGDPLVHIDGNINLGD